MGSDPETSGLGGKKYGGPNAGIPPKSPTKNFPQPEWAPLFPNGSYSGPIFGSSRRDQPGDAEQGIELGWFDEDITPLDPDQLDDGFLESSEARKGDGERQQMLFGGETKYPITADAVSVSGYPQTVNPGK